MEMDDNENFIDYQKMNFSSFVPQFNNPPNNAVNPFAAKFVNGGAGQILGLVSGPDGEVHYLNAASSQGNSPAQGSTIPTSLAQQLITLPITMPGAKPGDAQQTVQIQVVNPNAMQSASAAAQQHIPMHHNPFQQGTTVLTVAYAPQEGDLLQNHGLPEGMTVVAAIQPQDLHMLAQAQAAAAYSQQQQQNSDGEKEPMLKSIKQEPPDHQNNASEGQGTDGGTQQQQQQTCIQIPWQNAVSGQAAAELSEYLVRLQQQQQHQHQHQSDNLLPVQLNQFLKFNAEAIKREASADGPHLNGLVINCDYAQLLGHSQSTDQQPDNNNNNNNNNSGETKGSDGCAAAADVGSGEKGKKKRKYKKKPPKPKRPKPGQVHIATAIDGTVLFCCPECHRAYPEKENLEQHLTTHKIERRFICDICGAGLKRKEHLERHKLGHNPDRPYVCSVCLKGFKRKEHLNLHFVIHSGEKTEICGECGKGFYRKDHLRKHAKSHALKRQKEMNAQAVAAGLPPPLTSISSSSAAKDGKSTATGTKTGGSKKKKAVGSNNSSSSNGAATAAETTSIPIFEIPISNGPTTVTASVNIPRTTTMSTGNNTTIIHIPTGDNTTLPVHIQLPHMMQCGDMMSGVPTGSSSGISSAGQSNELPIMGS